MNGTRVSYVITCHNHTSVEQNETLDHNLLGLQMTPPFIFRLQMK